MKNFWQSIHYLRAAAALMVVLHHVPYALNNWGFSTGFSFDLGAWGVDLFFVISGFVMAFSCSLPKGQHAASRFYLGRLIRIVPMYWISILAPCLLSIIFPSKFRSFDFPQDQILQSMFFIPYLDDRGLMRPVLSQGWTLNFEMYFYTLIVISILFFSRFRTLWVAALLLSVFLLIRSGAAVFPVELSVYAAPIVFEFLLGMILFRLMGYIHPNHQHRLPLALLLTIATFVLLGIAPNDIYHRYDEFARLIFWGTAAFSMAMAFCLLEPLISRSKTLQILGDASYAIYLVHGLAFGLLLKFIPKSMPVLAAGVFAFIIAVFAGIFAHWVIEKPITVKLRNWFLPPTAKASS